MADGNTSPVPAGADAHGSQPLELDGPALRAFAHPLRTRLYTELEQGGPATSAQLATLVGQSRGATSYHLRQLARHGLLEEVPDRGSAKERWWRARPGGYAFNGDLLRRQPGTAASAETLISELVRQRNDELANWARQSRTMPTDWVQASINSRTTLILDRDELRRLVGEVTAVIHAYEQRNGAPPSTGPDGASPEASDDRARVVVTFDALPWAVPPAS